MLGSASSALLVWLLRMRAGGIDAREGQLRPDGRYAAAVEANLGQTKTRRGGSELLENGGTGHGQTTADYYVFISAGRRFVALSVAGDGWHPTA